MAKCLEIAQKLGIDRKAFKAALEYLVRVNLLLYYPNVLPEVVFCDPQVLLGKITQLVEYSHRLRGERFLPSSDKEAGSIRGSIEWTKYRDYGYVTEDLLNSLASFAQGKKDTTSKIFTASHFLQLMEALLIAASVETSPMTYFMPCLLQELKLEDLQRHRSNMSSIPAPLLIHFPGGWPQRGVFCSLVASLLSQDINPSWSIFTNKSHPYKNCISFWIEGTSSIVTLIDSFTSGYFEVHLNTREQTSREEGQSFFKRGLAIVLEKLQQKHTASGVSQEECHVICPQIREALSSAFDKLQRCPRPAPEYKEAFFCTDARCRAPIPHD